MNADKHNVLVEKLNSILHEKGLSSVQVSVISGRMPWFFDEFCRSFDCFTVSDYLSICRSLGIDPPVEFEQKRGPMTMEYFRALWK